MDRKIDDFNPILSKITRLAAAIKSLRFALFTYYFSTLILHRRSLDTFYSTWTLNITSDFKSCVYQHITGSAFIKRDQLDPWIKDQLRNALLSTILSLQLPNFVSCGRACPSHMTQNLVTVGTKLLIGEWFLFDPWSMDQADLVW